MTAYPTPENHGMWWLTTAAGWNRLHAVPETELTVEEMHAGRDEGEGDHLRTACGRSLHLLYPGVLSRLGLTRCWRCCRKLGIPKGNGTPCNEASRRARQGGAKEERTGK